MDNEDQYDEFGNLIGGSDSFSDSEVSSEASDNEPIHQEADISIEDRSPEDSYEIDESVVTTTEMNQYKPETNGEDDVEVLIETENTQSFDEPLVKPVAHKTTGEEYTLFPIAKKDIPTTSYDRNYMLNLLRIPERIRNVVVIGPHHSGKTSLVDLMVWDSHSRIPHVSNNIKQGWKDLRYMDSFKQEIERGLSIKLNGLTFMGTDLNDKSMVYNVIDAPGHVNFMDECAIALEASDIAIICLDIVEGVTAIVEKLINLCEKRNKRLIFVLNKVDRLIFELKIPPMDAYLKIKHIIMEINLLTSTKYSPELDNIVFASTKLGFTFTIREFVSYYYGNALQNNKIEQFIKKSYGNVTYSKGRFKEIADPIVEKPTFHDFFIVPLYKILGSTVALNENNLENFTITLKKQFSINIQNSNSLLKMDPHPLLRYICKLIFHEKQTGLYHSINSIPSPYEQHDEDDKLVARALKTLDYGGEEYTLVKVISGTIKKGTKVNIFDTNNGIDEDVDDDEVLETIAIGNIALMGGRYVLDIESAGPGQIILMQSISKYFDKSAVLFKGVNRSQLPIFGPIDYINIACFKIIIEPLIPKDLPKLLDALGKATKYYPGLITKIEESGEHTILGSGELYLDCLLYDLRNIYAKIEINISNPVTIFSEGVHKESFTAIPVESSNKNISLSISAKPLDRNLLADLSTNRVDEKLIERDIARGNMRMISKMLRNEYGWDSLTARNVWTFHHGNILVDDTLPEETDKELLSKYQEQIKQGFYWALNEGPLCEENIYGAQFNLLNFKINDIDKAKNIGSQLIPMVRKACYIALMTAEPIIMEPVYDMNIIIKTQLIPIVQELLKKRRGAKVISSRRIGGTPLSEVVAKIPVIDSVGMETDLRLSTNGGAQCQLIFWNNNWRRVPGSVLDEDAIIPKLKPAPYESLSRDFFMKTRRRKGISNDGFMSNDGPSLSKYIDPELFEQLKLNDLV
ncbi:hypothetical protein C6P45_000763 [Maudiozyma exigua]|uniref:Tr-type G domain-containing protein n=1 Tax=Maudiozyma exigua TaxID=34358 RepID=A0A9P7B894_MAUEX|nr:hypothetical protein C6P45_000763 [Kazachstania exigua]